MRSTFRSRCAIRVLLFVLLPLSAWIASSACAEPPADPAGLRSAMVEDQLVRRGIRNPRVLDAMRTVPRDAFVPASMRDFAYHDRPLPIGQGQTISQPYVVAAMTELLDPEPDDVVLEVGTGSGYQAAVLAKLVKKVYSIEILPELSKTAARALEAEGFDNVELIVGDGYLGLPEHAPYDGIVVTAAPPAVPPPLVEQLAVGARLVIPVGDLYQELLVYEKTESGVTERKVFPVRFVPMTGKAQE